MSVDAVQVLNLVILIGLCSGPTQGAEPAQMTAAFAFCRDYCVEYDSSDSNKRDSEMDSRQHDRCF